MADAMMGKLSKKGLRLLRFTSISVLLLLGSAPGSNAQLDCLDYSQFAHWAAALPLPDFQTATVLCLSDNLLFLGCAGDGVKIVDIGDPRRPAQIGSFPSFGAVTDIAAGGILVCVTDYYGLRIHDVSDPTAPVLLSVTSASQSLGVVLDGNIAYLAIGNNGVQVVDLGDPEQPVTIATLDTPGYAYKIQKQGDYVYVAASAEGLLVIDVSDPANPVLIGSVGSENIAKDIAIQGDYAFIADVMNGLQVIDVSDPFSPISLASLDTDGEAWSVSVAGGVAYVSDWEGGLLMVDVSNPSAPSLLCKLPGYYSVRDAQPSGEWVFVASDLSGLQIARTPSFETHDAIELIPSAYYNQYIATSNDLLYVLTNVYPAQLEVFDVTDPSHATLLGSATLPEFEASYLNLTEEAGTVYLTLANIGIAAVDARDPSNPAYIGYWGIVGATRNHDSNEDLLAVANGYLGLRIYTRSESGLLSYASTFQLNNDVTEVWLDDAIAYVRTDDPGLHVVDVSDPHSPFEIGFIDHGWEIRDLQIVGRVGYVLDDLDYFRILDLSMPSSPAIISSLLVDAHSGYSAVAGRRAYVQRTSHDPLQYDLQIIDISDSANPFISGAAFNAVGGRGGRPAISGQHLYVRWTGGIAYTPLQCGSLTAAGSIPPADVMDLRAFPNPFNPSLNVSFRLERGSAVTLEIFDPSGRLIDSPLREVDSAAGTTTIEWRPSESLAQPPVSGVYFVRLSGEGFEATEKVTLLK